jgi:spore coat protein U-like protein
MTRTWAIATVMVLAGVLGSAPAEAAKCTIWSAPVVFGTYDVFTTAPLDSTSGLAFDCNGGARNVSISISRGQAGSYVPRKLKKGTESLNYNLFLDAARTTIWGDGSGASETYFNRNPPNSYVVVPIYARVTAEQDVSAGTYADTVTVTINF